MSSARDQSNLRLTVGARTPHTVLPASVAHEINNPLDSLLNLLYLVEGEATLTEKGQRYLTLAKEEVRRVSQIAHETLDKSRVLVMPERTNVGELFAVVLDFYKQRLDSSRIKVQTRYSCGENIRVYAGQLAKRFQTFCSMPWRHYLKVEKLKPECLRAANGRGRNGEVFE
jgi:signal transduction histidine kinase